jgi:hypothetical protein
LTAREAILFPNDMRKGFEFWPVRGRARIMRMWEDPETNPPVPLARIAGDLAQRWANERGCAITIYRVPPVRWSRPRLIFGIRRPTSCVPWRQVFANRAKY